MDHIGHSSNADVLLQANDVEHSFGAVQVLEGVNLSIPSGNLTALVGPNGSGKSTLLRAMVGLIDVDGGTITNRQQSAGRSIGYMPQRPAFRPGFSVDETLSFYAKLIGIDESVTGKILKQVGLAQARNIHVEELSGGMTRLLGLAQAMLGDPPTIILDEPASGLDPGMREHVFEIALDLTDEFTGVLLASHDLELVERYSDRVAILDGGTLTHFSQPYPKSTADERNSLREIYADVTESKERSVHVRRSNQ